MRRVILLGAAAVLIATSARARPAKPADSAIILMGASQKIHVRADGKFTADVDETYQIQNEEGRARFGTWSQSYNATTTKFKLFGAETIIGSERIPVAEGMIEDKPVAGDVTGFDQNNQVKISFPKAEIGAKLHIKYAVKVKQVPFPGQYAARFTFGQAYLEEGSVLEIDSKIPLTVHVHDLNQKLKVEKVESHGGVTHLRVTLKAPIYEAAMNEPDSYPLSPAEVTSVEVSSAAGYNVFAQAVIQDYERVLRAPLPPLYAKILKDAAAVKGSPTDVINAVTTGLIDEIRYMGDWRTVKGEFVPRPLAEVATTKFGDCKDFAAGTVAILRHLGFKAYPAWIYRGDLPNQMPTLPIPFSNHAIAYVVTPQGPLWVDATNTASFAQGTFDDILNRAALVLDPARPRLEHTPAGKPDDARYNSVAHMSLQGDYGVHVEDQTSFIGAAAAPITGAELVQSKATIDWAVTRALAATHRIRHSEVGPYNLTSRIVKDATFQVKLDLDNYGVRRQLAAVTCWSPTLIRR